MLALVHTLIIIRAQNFGAINLTQPPQPLVPETCPSHTQSPCLYEKLPPMITEHISTKEKETL